MKPVVLKEFDELGKDLDEFPEFSDLAEKVGIKNFADALEIYSHHTLNREDQLKLILARFILWLGMASVGEFRVVTGKILGFDQYHKMPLFVSHIEIYHQAQELYQTALRVNKGKLA